MPLSCKTTLYNAERLASCQEVLGLLPAIWVGMLQRVPLCETLDRALTKGADFDAARSCAD